MNELPSSSVDMVFADPPYFLSNDGRSINSGKIVSVNKGEWDKRKNYDDINRFTFEWLKCCYRVLKSSGTIWVSGTMHNIFDVRDNMLKNGYRIINIIIWQKTDPPPLIYKNKFRFSYEFVIWAAKSKGYYFNYQAMYNIKNIEMSDVWVLPAVSNQEKKYGKHPTQKPECLIERIILSCTQENDTVLDPFMGSGTTCVVAKRLNRKFIGIEKEKDYFLIAHKRIIND
jgi:site-specific DNA-methyltransferase (adenine-specific)